jgi:hypothetical protein
VVHRLVVATLVALACPRLRAVVVFVAGLASAALRVRGLARLELELLLLGFRTSLCACATRNVGGLAIGAPATTRDDGVIESDSVA